MEKVMAILSKFSRVYVPNINRVHFSIMSHLWIILTLALVNVYVSHSFEISSLCKLCEEFRTHPKDINSLPEWLKSKNIPVNPTMLKQMNLKKIEDTCFLYCTINVTEKPRKLQKRFLNIFGTPPSTPVPNAMSSAIAHILETLLVCAVDGILSLLEEYVGLDPYTIGRKECGIKSLSLAELIKYFASQSAILKMGETLLSGLDYGNAPQNDGTDYHEQLEY